MMAVQPTKARFLSVLAKLILVGGIVAAGVTAAAYFMHTRPVVQKTRPAPLNIYVETVTAEKAPARAQVSGMGTVVPSQEIVLRPQVSGTVIAVDARFIPGGRIPAGSEILRIDPSDYEIEVAKRQSELEQAEADFQLEQGRQTVARHELDLLQKTSPEPLGETELALRKPQLAQARAKVAVAESALARARLDLERTVLTAPFSALVIDRQADLGARVSSQEPLATLVATDEYWIETAIPMERLQYLEFGRESGSPARVFSQSGSGHWDGRVLHSLGNIDEQTRMARILVSVKRPLDTGQNGGSRPLMLGDFVRVEIQGKPLGDMVVLPRKALRRGNAVWVAAGGRLDIRPVEIAFRSAEQIYLRAGLASGEAVILSDISGPVPGMPLDVAGVETASPPVAGPAGGPLRQAAEKSS